MDSIITILLMVASVGGAGWLLLRSGVRSWRERRRAAERMRQEDALKCLYKCELRRQVPTLEAVAGVLHLPQDETARLLTRLEEAGLLRVELGQIGLTGDGRASAVHIIRAHRLWERYLAEESGFAETEWHGQADYWEHHLTPDKADALAARLGNPTHDPHGDPIPTAEGEMAEDAGQPLSSFPVDGLIQIVHLEDEPPLVYAQLVAAGLYPGMVLRVVENTPERVRFLSEADEHVLAPMVASNVTVVPIADERLAPPASTISLADLRPGEEGEVVQLIPACRGAERRRFLDLGILPGTRIEAAFRSPSGDPTAYQIRGATIALRREQAQMILIKGLEQ